MFETGFIKLNRKILNWEWYEDDNVFRVFIHLLLTCNWEEKKWQGQTIRRGERVFSYAKLSEETNLTVRQIRTVLDKLKSTGEITIKATNKYSLVCVVNYGVYQDDTSQTTSKLTNNVANERQTSDKQTTTTKESNKNINKNIIKNKEKESNKEKSFDELINEFTQNETLRDELKEHLKVRKQKKGALTSRAIQLELNTLAKLSNNELVQIGIVRQSIERGWTGFFELKETKGKSSEQEKDELIEFLEKGANNGC